MKEIKTNRMEGKVSLFEKSRLVFSRDSVSPKYEVVPTICRRSLVSAALRNNLMFRPIGRNIEWNAPLSIVCFALYGSLVSAALRNNADAPLSIVCFALYGSLVSAALRNNADAPLSIVCFALYGSLNI
ncbi:hypothetical protein AYB33_01935 [Leptospira santarosai]|uniref:hypothetical protein n=1 Tax=Leptospira santarosai TaxID=28183 RepID=UPI0007786459|nr:hypothetical protein [Leptospira santarosai]KXZ31848.1 hypothetical protein AYB33_01935 [Leptospira santarosai]